MIGETSPSAIEKSAHEATELTPELLAKQVEEMIERGTFLGSIWCNGDSLQESTFLTVPYAYSVASGWRSVVYQRWYLRDRAPKGPRHHTDVDEMLLPIFESEVTKGSLKLYTEGPPAPDEFTISKL